MITEQPDGRGPRVGRFIGAHRHEPVFLDLHEIGLSDPVADDLADLWRTERGSEGWRRRFVMHCRAGLRQRYPSMLLDDGTVLPNSYDGYEALRTHAQVIGFADLTYASIVGFKYPGDSIGTDAVLLWELIVEHPARAIGRCPIYRTRTGETFIDQVVVEKLDEID